LFLDELEIILSTEGQSRIAYIVCRIAQYASRATQYENTDGRNCPELFFDFRQIDNKSQGRI